MLTALWLKCFLHVLLNLFSPFRLLVQFAFSLKCEKTAGFCVEPNCRYQSERLHRHIQSQNPKEGLLNCVRSGLWLVSLCCSHQAVNTFYQNATPTDLNNSLPLCSTETIKNLSTVRACYWTKQFLWLSPLGYEEKKKAMWGHLGFFLF